MLTAVRQYLVILAIALWLGGFTFYAAVVVPIGADVLGGNTEQGFVTQEVTRYLNWIGLAALAILLWNVISQSGKLLIATWFGMFVAQILLFVLHPRLDAMLNPLTHGISDDFHFWHEIYLWIAAIQWGLGLTHLWSLLALWRKNQPQATA